MGAIQGAINLGWVNNDFTGNQAVAAASGATNNAFINNNCFPGQKYN